MLLPPNVAPLSCRTPAGADGRVGSAYTAGVCGQLQRVVRRHGGSETADEGERRRGERGAGDEAAGGGEQEQEDVERTATPQAPEGQLVLQTTAA